MAAQHHLLRRDGYEIVVASGSYCTAMRDGRYVLVRWTGDAWIVL